MRCGCSRSAHQFVCTASAAVSAAAPAAPAFSAADRHVCAAIAMAHNARARPRSFPFPSHCFAPHHHPNPNPTPSGGHLPQDPGGAEDPHRGGGLQPQRPLAAHRLPSQGHVPRPGGAWVAGGCSGCGVWCVAHTAVLPFATAVVWGVRHAACSCLLPPAPACPCLLLPAPACLPNIKRLQSPFGDHRCTPTWRWTRTTATATTAL